ncbi:hypothetical protein A2V68_00045 [candidate division Kazan bacterium RBG_13_50_9]|uniref:LysM domain-containing protein n=1 Tax=candidate division Kazan bacterium RBG_13_50_9 TaxID=1798535 RepID=A0A1F4NR79_UNCK3|nr:MAG: hypothetical protein A2V68_00045 [candidate division Kazan bacterium RBG_13_50_9]
MAILEIKDSYASANPNSTLPPPSPPIKVWLLTFFIPYTQVAIVLGILFLLWFIWQFASWKRLSNLARRPVIAYKIKKGDHLTNVAQQYGASWKLVARLNNLKAPYGIEEGHTLYIPDASGTRMDIDIPHFLAFLIKPLAKKSIRQPKEETIIVERGDTKKDIEEFTKLPWATIAKHNDLKPTARLKAGWELKLPPKRHRKR